MPTGTSDLRKGFRWRPLPSNWGLHFAADTGTYMSGALVGFPPDSIDAFVLETFPNYRYVGGEIELLGESIPEWSRRVLQTYLEYRPGKSKIRGICDENAQFKTELSYYGINLHGNPIKLELRVEITREYFQNRHIWLAPWLDGVLAYELEHAVWPDDTNSAGRFERLKEQDHTLDCIEHICSLRPRHKAMMKKAKQSFVERELALHRDWRAQMASRVDPHLGRI